MNKLIKLAKLMERKYKLAQRNSIADLEAKFNYLLTNLFNVIVDLNNMDDLPHGEEELLERKGQLQLKLETKPEAQIYIDRIDRKLFRLKLLNVLNNEKYPAFHE